MIKNGIILSMVIVVQLCFHWTGSAVGEADSSASKTLIAEETVPDYIQRWGSEDSEIIDFIYYFPEAPLEISTALKLWQPVMDEYKKRLKFPRPLRVMFFMKRDELEKILNSRPVALAFLPLDYYFENKKRLHVKPYSTFVISKDPQYNIQLFVRTEDSYQSLADLKGKKLATAIAADNPLFFLSRIVFAGSIDASTFFDDILYPQDAYSSIQALRIKIADAILLSEYNLKILNDLDPGYTSHFRSIFTSPQIPAPPFVYFEDNITQSDLKVFLKVTKDITELPTVKQTLLFLKLESLIEVSEEDYRQVEKLWWSTRGK